MIYLIISKGEDFIEGKGNIKTFYKIGYTDDNKFTKRMSAYYLHNPFCKLLYTIPNGTIRQEKLIHYKFKNLRSYRNEWYYGDKSIIDFFNKNKTIEDLDKELGDHKYFSRDVTGKLTDNFLRLRKYIQNSLTIFYNKQKDVDYDLVKKSINNYIEDIGKSVFSEDDFLDKFEKDNNKNIREVLENNKKLLSNKISQFFEDFERNNVFKEKMRLLCETSLSESELSVILDQIPMTYKNYYLTVGPKRCKALGYNKNEVEREFKDLILDTNTIKVVIYQEFKEGEIYTNKDAKEKLGKIYESLGYNKTPKATDLENYFKLMRTTKTDNGKRLEGFKIIKKL